jgi:hypothetical protein
MFLYKILKFYRVSLDYEIYSCEEIFDIFIIQFAKL